MSKRTKQHNKRSANLCRVCLINSIGKTRLAYGHTICQACAKKHPEADVKTETNEEQDNE